MLFFNSLTFYLPAWKRNHEQFTSPKNAKAIGASQDVKAKTIFNPKHEQGSPQNYDRTNHQKGKNSDKSIRKGLMNNEEMEHDNLSSSTNSSFSSVASIKKKPNVSNSKNLRKLDTPSPQIPPRAPVLETLKRTKRELVNKQSYKKETVRNKVRNYICV